MIKYKRGDFVQCPPDNGNPGFKGTVKNVGPNVYTNIHGINFQWVTINPHGVWPSHRLELIEAKEVQEND